MVRERFCKYRTQEQKGKGAVSEMGIKDDIRSTSGLEQLEQLGDATQSSPRSAAREGNRGPTCSFGCTWARPSSMIRAVASYQPASLPRFCI